MSTAAPRARWTRAARWFCGLLALQNLLLVVWLLSDHTAAMHDDSAAHLRNALLAYDLLSPRHVHSLAVVFAPLQMYLSYPYPYPPLCYLLAVPCELLAGLTPAACCLVNLAAYNFGLLGLFRLGERLWTPRVGLLAAALAGTSPMLLYQVQQFWVDATLWALCIWLVLAVSESDGGRHAGWTIAAGLCFGLGMLTKYTFPMYGLGPGLWLVVAALRGDAGTRRNLLRAVLTAALVCVPWYAANLRELIFTIGWSFGKEYNYTPQGWLPDHLFYLLDVQRQQLFCLLTPVVLVGLGVELSRRRRGPRAVLLGYWLVTFVCATAVHNKSSRYTPPLVFPLVLWGAAWVESLAPRRRAALLALCALGLALNNAASLLGTAGRELETTRLWANGPTLFVRNRLVRGRYDQALAQVAQLALDAARDLPTVRAGRPAPILITHPLSLDWGWTPMGLTYSLSRAEVLANRALREPRFWFAPSFNASWGVDVPDRALAECALAILPETPQSAPLVARVAALPGWRRVGAVTLPSGSPLAVWRRD